MNKGSAFSPEYDIINTTESKSSIKDNIDVSKENVLNDFINKIESYYELSKPRRKLTRARIIT